MTPEERAEFVADVASAIKSSEPVPVLTEEEQQWVRLAIQKEAQSIKLRQAVQQMFVGCVIAVCITLLRIVTTTPIAEK